MDLLTPDFGVIFWQTITIIFVFFLLKKFAWSSILKTLDQREFEINDSLSKAGDARKFLNQVENKKIEILESAKIQSENILFEANKTKDIILEDAKLKANNIVLDMLQKAKEEILKEKTDLMNSLTKDISKISIQIAEKLVHNHLNSDKEQDILIEKMIKNFKN